MNLLRRANGLINRQGRHNLAFRTRSVLDNYRSARRYQRWIRETRLDDETRAQLRAESDSFLTKPLISVLVPVCDVDERWLRRCVESVMNQVYVHWQLCLADDCSTKPHVRKVLTEYAAKDERIIVRFREQNGNISAASNTALEVARGEFVALLDHDDELSEDALFRVAKETREFPDSVLIYSDEDRIDERGRRSEPVFKPDWSPDLLNSVNYVNHLSVYRTDAVRGVGGFTLGLEGSQDYDLLLRVTESRPADQIRHIPRVLYHWRSIPGSVALSPEEKPYAHERAREAIRAHLSRSGLKAEVTPTHFNYHRVKYGLPEAIPEVSLVVFRRSERPRHDDTVQLPLGGYPSVQITNVHVAENIGFAAALNLAVAETKGELICFVEAGLNPTEEDWLFELIATASQPTIGVGGAKLLDADSRIVHGGFVLGTGEIVSNAYAGLPASAPGHLVRNLLMGNVSAVSISCLAVRREMFDAVGGFDAENLPNRYFDVDFCLKVLEAGYRVVFDPYVSLRKSPGRRPLNCEIPATYAEQRFLSQRWPESIENDPYYNPNLSKKKANFTFEP